MSYDECLLAREYPWIFFYSPISKSNSPVQASTRPLYASTIGEFQFPPGEEVRTKKYLDAHLDWTLYSQKEGHHVMADGHIIILLLLLLQIVNIKSPLLHKHQHCITHQKQTITQQERYGVHISLFAFRPQKSHHQYHRIQKMHCPYHKS
mmetsp:Transcript_33353/g.72074  ORF Transcript_33353/g.72074 Transcript_33353/m.72074 type:complete len:150 (+) Transcript_33353:311-760(+)